MARPVHSLALVLVGWGSSPDRRRRTASGDRLWPKRWPKGRVKGLTDDFFEGMVQGGGLNE